MFSSLSYKISIFVFGISLFLLASSLGRAQLGQQGDLGMNSNIIPSLTMELNGGVNDLGRRTFLTGNAVDFGNVIFTQPEFISNGDAYLLDDGNLVLEATLVAKLTYSGTPNASLELSKLPAVANTFSQTRYSTGIRRDDRNNTIPTYADTSTVKEGAISGIEIPFRVLAYVSPAQSGLLSDNFRLIARTR